MNSGGNLVNGGRWLLLTVPLASRVVPGQSTRLPMEEMKETRVRSLGWEGTLEEEMATHSRVLAW